MALVRKEKYITGGLIVNGTIEGDQISANTVTANKFSGAVEEEYYAYHSSIYINTSQSTLFEFDFPEPEFQIAKGRHIEFEAQGYMYKSSSSTANGLAYYYPQVQVPQGSTVSYNAGIAYPDTGAATYWQRAYMIGNVANKIGAGQVYVNNQVKTYKNLHYKYDHELTNLVTGGEFITGDEQYWTVSNGTLTVNYGYGYLYTTSTTEKATMVSNAITVNDGVKHRFRLQKLGGTASQCNVYISTSTDIADAIGTQIFTSNTTINIDVDIPVGVTTVYYIIQNDSTTTGQYIVIDGVRLYELQERTYLDISAYPTNPVPSGGALLAHVPFGLTSAGTWVTFNTLQDSYFVGSGNSTYYRNINHKVYLGRIHLPLKCRLQARRTGSGISGIQIQHLQVGMHSRIVEVVIPPLP